MLLYAQKTVCIVVASVTVQKWRFFHISAIDSSVKTSFVFSQQEESVVIEAGSFQTAEWMKSVFRALIQVKQQLRIDPRRKKVSRCKLALMVSTGRAASVKID